MKVSGIKKRNRPSKKRAAAPFFIMDEFHQAFPPMPGLLNMAPQKQIPIFIAGQQLVKTKRGKPLLTGWTRNARTGEPFPPPPEKFLPAQVKRRLA